MHQKGEQEGMPEIAPLAFAMIQKHYGLSFKAVALAQPWHVLLSLRWQLLTLLEAVPLQT